MDPRDLVLIQSIDVTMAEAVRKGGAWIACRVGCWDCCRGTFEITALDAARLRAGFADLSPETAGRVRERARHATALAADHDEACPALDPAMGSCDLYAHRPVTCRVFGPAVRLASGEVGACELCFVGAKDGEIAACAVTVDPDGAETAILAGMPPGPSTVAAVLAAC